MGHDITISKKWSQLLASKTPWLLNLILVYNVVYYIQSANKLTQFDPILVTRIAKFPNSWDLWWSKQCIWWEPCWSKPSKLMVCNKKIFTFYNQGHRIFHLRTLTAHINSFLGSNYCIMSGKEGSTNLIFVCTWFLFIQDYVYVKQSLWALTCII